MADKNTKNYIDELADDIGERCDTNNERLLRMYALLGLVRGTAVTPTNVHDAWAAWTAGLGLQNPAIIPLDILSKDDGDPVQEHCRMVRDVASAIAFAVEAKLHREARAEK